ncbi:MAG: hypothetical protein ACJAZO_004181 [Myxococcota bacterium]|jgi:hypothetical protein
MTALLSVPNQACAQSQTDAAEEEEEEDIWAILENIPARNAYDVAVHAAYTNMGYWSDNSGPYIGFGVRGTYGWIVGGKHRLGPSLGLSVEGPVPIYSTIALEPQFAWDRASKGFVVGASVGPAFLYHSSEATIRSERAFSIAPMASFRIGYSKPFSRLGKRFFIVLEPKGRVIVGNETRKTQPDLSMLISVGSGRGR